MFYSNPHTILEKRINEALGKSEEGIVSDLIRIALLKTAEKDSSLLIYTEIYNLLGPDKFTSLVRLLDGRTLRLPKKDKLKDSVLLSLCYYYKNIEKKSWEQIKDILGIQDLNTIKMGIHISQLDSFLDKMINRGQINEENKSSSLQ